MVIHASLSTMAFTRAINFLLHFVLFFVLPLMCCLIICMTYFTILQSFNLVRSAHNQFSSVQPLDWVVGGLDRRFSRFSSNSFCRKPLCTLQACGDVHSLMLSIQHFLCRPWHRHSQRCPEGLFWRGCRGVWYAQTMRVSISGQLQEEVPVDQQGSWSCSAPSRWSCTPSRRCWEASSGIGFRKPRSFFHSQQVGSVFYSHRRWWRRQETCKT